MFLVFCSLFPMGGYCLFPTLTNFFSLLHYSLLFLAPYHWCFLIFRHLVPNNSACFLMASKDRWLDPETRRKGQTLRMRKSTLNRVRSINFVKYPYYIILATRLLETPYLSFVNCPVHLQKVFLYLANLLDMGFLSLLLCADQVQISELLARTIGDAHNRTCLFSGEHIADMLRKPQDISKVHFYKNMVRNTLQALTNDPLLAMFFSFLQAHEELWLECAQRLTAVIQQIIEFAKMVPGFMKLSQDDQIVLLKTGKLPALFVIPQETSSKLTKLFFPFCRPVCFANPKGSFELAVLRMSRYYDLTQNAVLFGDTMLPVAGFLTPDTVEVKLVTSVFDFAKALAELKLTEIQLALYSAFVLLSSGECVPTLLIN